MQAQHVDGSYDRNIRAYKLVAPLVPRKVPNPASSSSTVIFTSRFPEKEGLGPRLRFDAYCEEDSLKVTFPDVDRVAVQELLDIAQKVLWKALFASIRSGGTTSNDM